MTLANQEIRDLLKEANVKQWQIADELGISEGNFSRKMRYEVSEEEKKTILEAIDRVKGRVDNG